MCCTKRPDANSLTIHTHHYVCQPSWVLGQRVYTDSEIYDPIILSHLENEIAHLLDLSSTFAVPFPPTAELVINVYQSEGELRSEYFCIDHTTRTVFFLHVFRASWLDAWMELPGVKSKALLRTSQFSLEGFYQTSVDVLWMACRH